MTALAINTRRQPHRRRLASASSCAPVVFLIWALPALWLIGGERLLAPFLAIAIAAYYAYSRPPVRQGVPSMLIWAGGFLAAYFLSASQVSSVGRLFTYVWDFFVYIGFFSIIYLIYRQINNNKDIRIILLNVMALMAIAHFLSFLYFATGEIRFNTLLGMLLPGSLRETDTGRMIAVHSVGRTLWFFGINDRISSIFGTSIHYGSAILLSVPLTIYFAFDRNKIVRVCATILVIVSAYMLFYAQARTAIILSVLMGLACFVIYPMARRARLTPSLVALMLIASITLTVILGIFLSDYITAIFNEFFIEARASSAQKRMAVYAGTFEGIMNRPIFGHGTQISVDYLPVPLGSHNWYLGVLFKHGLIGFIAFLGMLISLNGRVIAAMVRTRDPNRQLLLSVFVITLIGHALLCLTLEPIVGGIHFYLLGIIAGLALASAATPPKDQNRFRRSVFERAGRQPRLWS